MRTKERMNEATLIGLGVSLGLLLVLLVWMVIQILFLRADVASMAQRVTYVSESHSTLRTDFNAFKYEHDKRNTR